MAKKDKDYDWTKANWWDYPEDDDVEVKEIEVDISDLMLPKEYAYGGGVGNLFEPTPTYHQYHDMTAPITYGTLMDQRRGFANGGVYRGGGADYIGLNPNAPIEVEDLTVEDNNGNFLISAANALENQDGIIGAATDIMSPGVQTIEGSLIPGDKRMDFADSRRAMTQPGLDKFRPMTDEQVQKYGQLSTQNINRGVYDPYGIKVEDGRFSYDMNKTSLDDFNNIDTFSEDFDKNYDASSDALVPGMGTKAIDFKDAPVDFRMRANNPMKGPIDAWKYRALRAGDPLATARWMEKQGLELPPNLQGIDTRNILEKTTDKFGNFLSDTKEGITTLGGKVKKGGQMVFGPLMALANTRNPLNPNAANYNPALQSQVDFLKEQGGFGVIDQSGLNKITGGRLAGKNLISGFGTNDIFGMYEKDLEKLEKSLAKLPDRWSKLKKNNPAAYKQKYDNMVAKINQNKAEQQWLKDNNIKKGSFPNKKIKPTDKKDDSPYQKGSWGGHGSVEAYDKSQKATYDRAVDRHRGSTKSTKSSKSSSKGNNPWGRKDGGIINIIR